MNLRLTVGHTAITWPDARVEDAVACCAVLGFKAFETFGWVLASLENENRMDIFSKYGIPLVSGYFSIDIVNPDVRDAEMAKLTNWGRILSGAGGKWATFGGNGAERRSFRLAEHIAYLADFVNEAAKRLREFGVGLNFHPHTGTPVETAGEIDMLFESVNTDLVGFAPDVGQIQKGGSDPVEYLKKYLSIVRLVHLKDYSGSVEYDGDGKEIDTSGFTCYCPLGNGVTQLPEMLDILEKSTFDGYVMVELDAGKNMPMSAEEATTISRDYLAGLGYGFRV
jgi:inosose dehydratase